MGLSLAAQFFQTGADVVRQGPGLRPQGALQPCFQPLQHGLRFRSGQADVRHPGAQVRAGRNGRGLHQHFGGLVIRALTHELDGLGEEGIFGRRVRAQQPRIDLPRPVPLAGAYKSGRGLPQIFPIAEHILLALPGHGHAQLRLALQQRAVQGALKGGNGMIPLPFFQTAHAYPEVVFGATHGLEQQRIGFQGSIKGAGVGQFFGPF